MVFDKKSKKTYEWGTRKYGVSAQIVGELLESIETEKGAVTSKDFLEASRSEDSPTHKLFEWDDKKAAENYRVDVAGRIMNALVVRVTIIESEKPKEAKAFVRISDEKTGGRYHNLHYALSIPHERDFVLRQALSELMTFKRKYETLSELATVIDAINGVIRDESNGEY